MNSSFIDFTIFSVLEAENVLKQCEGDNQKGLFILCQDTDKTSDNLLLLGNILKAMQYDLQQDTLLYSCTSKTKFRFKDLATNPPIQHFLSFGIAPQQIGLNHTIPLYQATTIDDRFFLFAHSLSEIAQNKAYKKALWMQLKATFL